MNAVITAVGVCVTCAVPFVQLHFETLGSWGTETCAIIKDIGRKLVAQTGEQRATCFLVQKISTELQRVQAQFWGLFPSSRGLEEIFYILKDV